MPAVRFRPLPGPFGVEIMDVDLAASAASTLSQIAAILYQHQFIVLHDQQLTLQQFAHLSQSFGKARPHFLDHLRMQGHPEILLLSNIHEARRKIGVYEGACFWHTDVAYESPPNSATLVYSILAPERGAHTHFADMFSAYDALPERTKRDIEPLIVVHHYGNCDDLREDSPTAAERLTDKQKRRIKQVHQPLVMRHPVTGRRALYGVAGSSFGIVGMPDDEALDLLSQLAAHATQEQFTTRYDYRVGDVACWDTFSTLHKASPQVAAKRDDPHARLLWRIALTGTSPLFASRANPPAGQVCATSMPGVAN